MRPDTKQHLHVGVNFVLAPAANVTTNSQLQFQQYLSDPIRDVVFDTAQRQDAAFVFQRTSLPLEVRIGPVGPQVGQLLITAPQPARTLDEVLEDFEAVVDAYRQIWRGPVQVIRRDCTVRHLYAVRESHALQYIWERRLHQQEDSVQIFGRPVLGGGMRFVMPPRQDVADDPAIEVKIESLLADASQLFVETSFVWGQPHPGTELEPSELVRAVEGYMCNEVTKFILSE